jgi:N-acetylneuraminic acid mutarotase
MKKNVFLMAGILLLSLLLLPGLSGCGATPTPKSTPSIARTAVAAAKLNDKIYIIGGTNLSGDTLGLVEEYDPLRNLWSTKARIPTERASAAAVVVDGYIYVMGGRDGNTVLASLERYDPSTNSWSKRAAMPTARWFLMAAEVGGKIYAIGGIAGTGNQRKDLDVVEVYDPASDTWTVLDPMPTPRSNAGVAVLGERIFIIGGRTRQGASARVDVYDPANNQWLSAPSLDQSLTSLAVCVFDNKIYAIGGAQGGTVLSSTRVYSPQTEKWTSGPNLSQPRMGAVCGVVGESMYIIGGVSGSTSSPTLLTSVERMTSDSSEIIK